LRRRKEKLTAVIDLEEFPYFKRWFEELSERPAVQRGLAVTAGELEDPASITPEEQERRRKILYNQRARPAPAIADGKAR
jgi:GST-like protein